MIKKAPINLLTPLIFFFFLYLFLQLLKAICYFIYLVQLKEYRLDRLKAHFKTRSGKKQLLKHLNLLNWLKIQLPKPTLRALLVFIFSFYTSYNLFFLFLRFTFKLVKEYPNSSFFLVIAGFFIINLGSPLIVILYSELTELLLLPLRLIITKLAKLKIKHHPNLQVIAITGSFGKSSVKEMLSFVLEGFFKVLKTPNNCNTEIGLALLILKKLRKRHEIMVVEMGAYKRGEIDKMCQLLKPQIGIITGINEQHLALFGTLKDTQWAKFELIKNLPKNGLAIFNVKSPLTRRLYRICKINKKKYGLQLKRLKLRVEGKWNLINIQPTLIVANYLKLPVTKVMQRINKLDNLNLNFRVFRGIKGTQIIDSSYSANPDGFMAALYYLQSKPGKTKVLITPGIIELGSASHAIHQKIGQMAKKICDKIILTKIDFEKEIRAGLQSRRKSIITVEEDEFKVVENLRPLLGRNTTILVIGRVSPFIIKKLSLEWMIKVNLCADKKTWDRAILSFPEANFLQSWNWGEFQKKLGHKIFRYTFVVNNKIDGLCLLIQQLAKRANYLECPGGPLIKWNEPIFFEEFIKLIKQVGLQNGCQFIRVRPQLAENYLHRVMFKNKGFISSPMHLHAETTLQLNLKISEEAILRQMRKNTRYLVRKAIAEKVKIVKSQDINDVNYLYNLQLETVKRRHFVPFSKKYFTREMESFVQEGQLLLFKALYQNQVLAAAFIIFYNQEAIYHYSGSSSTMRKIPASYLLQWEAIKEAKKRGCTRYNFWGIAPQNKLHHRFAGVTVFKKGFGGQDFTYLHAHDLPLKFSYWLVYFFETLRKIFRRL